MTVRPLRDGRYVVETDGGTYVVDLDAGSCGCPDHAIRGARCKHVRRVAMDVTNGSVPAPSQRTGVCAVCGAETFVPRFSDGPHLCRDHEPERGEMVRDRETDSLLVVTDVVRRSVDEYTTEEGFTLDEYETNTHYGRHEPVVEAVYVGSISPNRDPATVKRYGFPASRLRRLHREYGSLGHLLDADTRANGGDGAEAA